MTLLVADGVKTGQTHRSVTCTNGHSFAVAVNMAGKMRCPTCAVLTKVSR